MLLLSKISKIHDNAIHVPMYHRGHLSLMTGTPVEIVCIPKRECNPLPWLAEVIISPIPYDSWKYLTRINARFENRPGIMSKLLAALHCLKIKVLYHAVGPSKNGIEHKVELIVDPGSYYAKKKKTDDAKINKDHDVFVLNLLELKLKSIFISELCLDRKRLRLKVRPMEGFRKAQRAYDLFTREKHYPNPSKTTSVVKRGNIPLNDVVKSLHHAKNVIITTDTKDHILRAFLLDPDQSCTYLNVIAPYDSCAPALVATSLSSHFTVVTSASRLPTHSSAITVEYMLFSPEFHSPGDEQKRRSIISKLIGSEAIEKYQIKIQYSKHPRLKTTENSRQSTSDGELQHATRIKDSVDLEKDLLAKPTEDILKKRLKQFKD